MDQYECGTCHTSDLVAKAKLMPGSTATTYWELACSNGHRFLPLIGTEIFVKGNDDDAQDNKPGMATPHEPKGDVVLDLSRVAKYSVELKALDAALAAIERIQGEAKNE